MPGIGRGISPYFRKLSSGTPFFNDLFPGATWAASFWQLTPTATNACKVRRDNDDLEAIIPFASREISRQAITDHVGSNSGYVSEVYDQFGVNHLIQTNHDKQPRIVSSGTIEEDTYGNVTMFWDGVDDYLALTAQISDSQPWSIIQKCKRFFSGQAAPMLSSSVADAPFALMNYADGFYYSRSNTKTFVSTETDTSVSTKVLAAISNGTDNYIWNGHAAIAGSNFAVGGTGNFIDFGRRESIYAKGYCNEVIFFNSDQTADILEIIANRVDFRAQIELPASATPGYLIFTDGQSNSIPRSPIEGNLSVSLQGLQPDTYTHYKQSNNATDNGFWSRLYEGKNAYTEGGISGYYGYQSSIGAKLKNTYGKAGYFVSDGVGGTGLDDAIVPGWYPTHVGEYYDTMITHIQQAMAQATNVSLTPVLIWNQGEFDAGNATYAANYEANLLTLFAAIRSDLSLPSLKIIIVKLGSDTIYAHKTTVRAAQQAVADAQANTYIYESPYPISADGEHYNPIVANYTGVQARQLIGEALADLISTF